MLLRSWWSAALPLLKTGSQESDMSVRTSARIAAALVGAAVLGLGLAPLAGAQSDPYGSTSTTAPSEVEATCGLTLSKATPGTEVTATVGGVFFGETVRIRFDGTTVATVTAPLAAASAGAPVAFGGAALPAQASTTTVQAKFTVPRDAVVGKHVVTAVGDTFTCFCNPNGEFTVLAAAGGRLVKTGVNAALVLVVAVALLLVGRVLLGTSRRRRAAEQAHEERVLTSVGR